MNPMSFRIAALALSVAMLAACKPEPPPTDQPPEPKAVASAASEATLQEAVKAPIDQAKAVQDTVDAAADRQRAEVDASAN